MASAYEFCLSLHVLWMVAEVPSIAEQLPIACQEIQRPLILCASLGGDPFIDSSLCVGFPFFSTVRLLSIDILSLSKWLFLRVPRCSFTVLWMSLIGSLSWTQGHLETHVWLRFEFVGGIWTETLIMHTICNSLEIARALSAHRTVAPRTSIA